jgi:hypothetical protein
MAVGMHVALAGTAVAMQEGAEDEGRRKANRAIDDLASKANAGIATDKDIAKMQTAKAKAQEDIEKIGNVSEVGKYVNYAQLTFNPLGALAGIWSQSDITKKRTEAETLANSDELTKAVAKAVADGAKQGMAEGMAASPFNPNRLGPTSPPLKGGAN